MKKNKEEEQNLAGILQLYVSAMGLVKGIAKSLSPDLQWEDLTEIIFRQLQTKEVFVQMNIPTKS